jgi:hypothetical protein
VIEHITWRFKRNEEVGCRVQHQKYEKEKERKKTGVFGCGQHCVNGQY